MTFDLSPAVERVCDAIRELPHTATFQDWFLALTADEDGKPASRLVQIGLAPTVLRDAVRSNMAATPFAPPDEQELLGLARMKSLEIHGDSTITTEFLLLAVVTLDHGFRRELEALGLSGQALEYAMAPPGSPIPEEESVPVPFVVHDPVEWADTSRILDVNLNRARETLRILDDYCRFVLNDALLTEEVKRLRHRLAEATGSLPSAWLIRSRETAGDVGTGITVNSEYERQSPAQVAAINLKRLQEALRSVEEFGKLHGGEFASIIEQVRYRAYTLERAIATRNATHQQLAQARLYALLMCSQCAAAMDWTIAEAAAGGVQIIQLREKSLSDRELLERAVQVRRWTREAGVLFIMNDRPDIARIVEADGVHLGQDDMAVASARRLLGPDAIIGVSTHSIDQLRQAVLDGADYVGLGPTFPSTTKSFSAYAGLDYLRAASEATSLPAFALGGITTKNVNEVLATGVRRVAVSAAIAESDDPQAVAQVLRSALDRAAL